MQKAVLRLALFADSLTHAVTPPLSDARMAGLFDAVDKFARKEAPRTAEDDAKEVTEVEEAKKSSKKSKTRQGVLMTGSSCKTRKPNSEEEEKI